MFFGNTFCIVFCLNYIFPFVIPHLLEVDEYEYPQEKGIPNACETTTEAVLCPTPVIPPINGAPGVFPHCIYQQEFSKVHGLLWIFLGIIHRAE